MRSSSGIATPLIAGRHAALEGESTRPPARRPATSVPPAAEDGCSGGSGNLAARRLYGGLLRRGDHRSESRAGVEHAQRRGIQPRRAVDVDRAMPLAAAVGDGRRLLDAGDLDELLRDERPAEGGASGAAIVAQWRRP